jgi:EAL domain-containing protein (putative c-di-GMP-specific phosphodiesterase class I)/CheY-like chemotaxis protein
LQVLPPIRVLVAEDDAALRASLCAVIERERDFELVGAAADGVEAVAIAAREHPDVAVVDVRMPSGGAIAARGIRRESPQTRVLVLSGVDDRATLLEMIEAGVVGYLVKGAPIEKIVQSIAGAAAGRGSLSGEVAGDVIEELVGQLSERRREADRRRHRELRIRKVIDDPRLLVPVFQPIYDLDRSRPVGVEALARFLTPPERSPDRWFAEAEEVGLRDELELVAAARALDALPAIPSRVYLSVNVSPSTVRTREFRELVARSDPARIVVEITEHAPIEEYEHVVHALAQLRDLGVRVAIDDAGAGFASLRHILRLEPDFIKLDRTLIDGIESDRSRSALAAGLITFADKIEATIVAEGIEQPGDVIALRELGVRYGQGFLLARPGPLRPGGAFAGAVELSSA